MTSKRDPILIEGYTADEILQVANDELAAFVFAAKPFVFKVGSAIILGEFRQSSEMLTIELAQIEGGGEGVLPTLWILAGRYAKQHNIPQVEWIVHAINCAKPNLKLRRILNRLGFSIEQVSGVGEAYHLIVSTNSIIQQGS